MEKNLLRQIFRKENYFVHFLNYLLVVAGLIYFIFGQIARGTENRLESGYFSEGQIPDHKRSGMAQIGNLVFIELSKREEVLLNGFCPQLFHECDKIAHSVLSSSRRRMLPIFLVSPRFALLGQKMAGESNDKSAHDAGNDISQNGFWSHVVSGITGAITYLLAIKYLGGSNSKKVGFISSRIESPNRQ